MNLERKEINFEIKEVTEGGMFRGYGSTFGGEPDSYGDIITKGAFGKSLEKGGRNGSGIAMLWQHESNNPIGVWKEVREDSNGLFVVGQLALTTQQGKEAYELLKIGALNGLSIGYKVVDAVYDKAKDIREIKEIDLWEVSLVTFPANTKATITDVKKIIEEAKTERELERGLREIMSCRAAEYFVSICDKKKLFGKDKVKLEGILASLKKTNELFNKEKIC